MINKIPYEETKNDIKEIREYIEILIIKSNLNKDKFKEKEGEGDNEYQH